MNLMSIIPPDAKKVFDGVLFEVWQWNQEEFDGTLHTYERLRRRDTGSAICVVGDTILIEHQEQPARGKFISFPGGTIEYGEDSLQGTIRELLEETGYVSDNWEHYKTFTPSHIISWSSMFYIARDCRKIQDPILEGGEKIVTECISFDDFLHLADNPLFQHKDLEATLVRAQYDEETRRTLHHQLFGS